MYTIIHSVGNIFFFSNILYFSRVLINMKTISVEYITRLVIAGTTEFSEEEKFLISHILLVYGGFHLHLLVFPFVYQFNSRMWVLVNSSFANY